MLTQCKSKVIVSKCEYIETCSLFTVDVILKSDRAKERFREMFCLSGCCSCARRMVHNKLGPEFVPALMLPNQLDWARQILSDNNVPCNQ